MTLFSRTSCLLDAFFSERPFPAQAFGNIRPPAGRLPALSDILSCFPFQRPFRAFPSSRSGRVPLLLLPASPSMNENAGPNARARFPPNPTVLPLPQSPPCGGGIPSGLGRTLPLMRRPAPRRKPQATCPSNARPFLHDREKHILL